MASETQVRSTDEAVDRLLKAWRGEIQAGAMYALIARREKDSRRAAILRRMSEVEAKHRARLEARMRELGVEIPDPASVHISRWAKLQARFAPIDRLLADREAAEDSEVDDLYHRPTGDAGTDTLLREIRKDEGSHRIAVREMRGDGAPDGQKPTAQTRLDRILGHETWH